MGYREELIEAYTKLQNENGIAIKRLDALICILKNNFGKEQIYFASDIDTVKKELTKCVSELLTFRNDWLGRDYGTIEAIIFNNDINCEEEDEKYVKIIRHCGCDILNFGIQVLESDVFILTECANNQSGYWFSYQNIEDFGSYIENALSIIKKEYDNVDDVDCIYEINKEINNIINKYWGNTVEFDYAEFESANN